jgi:hypothetical protein
VLLGGQPAQFIVITANGLQSCDADLQHRGKGTVMPKVDFHTDLKKAAPKRHTALRTSAAATTALAAPFVRGAHAAAKLSFGVWDHWVHFRV